MVWKNWAPLVTRNLGEKLLSLVIAVGLWFSVTNQLEFEQNLIFPIEYANRPDGLTPVQALPTEAHARVRGKGKFLRYTLRDGVCRVDLSGNQIGLNTLLVNGGNVVLPGDAQVSRVVVTQPNRITVEFDETVIRDIPITPALVGAPASKHVQVGKTFVNPPIARVKGPRKLVDEIALISTAEINIDNHRSTVRKKVKLIRPRPETVEIGPATVEIGITIEPVITRTIEQLELAVGSLPKSTWRAAFRPPTIDVEISGARSIVEVAAKEVSSLVFAANKWSLGTSVLRFKETRGREIVFAPADSLPLVMAPLVVATNGDPPAGPPNPSEKKPPPAVRSEIIAALPLPRDVEVLTVKPERLVLTIQPGGVEPSP